MTMTVGGLPQSRDPGTTAHLLFHGVALLTGFSTRTKADKA